MPTNEYDISKAFKRIENDLMDSMIRNLARHQVEEDELGMTWEQWQVLQLQELEQYRRKNANMFADDFTDINQRVEVLYRTTAHNAQANEESRILEKIKTKQFTPSVDKGGFFRLNEAKLEALIMATQGDFARAEFAMLRRANDQYRQIIYDSMVYANVTNDYKKAVDMATHDFLQSGINSVVYKNGARHTVSDYASMALRTGNKRAYLMGEAEAHDRYGLHTVRVNKRQHACPKCVGFLGRLLIDDVYGGGTRAEAVAKGIPTLSDAMRAGFLHPNCKDTYSVYIEGVSKPADSWTPQEIGEITDEYNLEQEIKHAQDTVDTYNRMAKYSLDPDNQLKYQARAREWQARVNELKLKQGVVADMPVAPTYHEGIRQMIPIEYDASTLKGIYSLANATIDSEWSPSDRKYVLLDKPIKIAWNDLTADTQRNVRWQAPQRVGKDFIIRPEDLRSYGKSTLSDFTRKRLQKALDAGYNYEGWGHYYKYNNTWSFHILEKDGKTYVALNGVEDSNVVSKKTIDAINKRQKAVSKGLWDEGVHFKDLTARRGDNWVTAMQKFHTEMEADKPVTLVSRAQYDKIKGEELYRGIAPVSHLRSDISMSKTPMQCAEQLMTGGVGDCFPSRGVYGDVVAYLSNSKQTAFNYATGYRSNAGGVIVRMKIKEDAKTITYKEAKDLFNEIADALGETKAKSAQPYFSRKQVAMRNDVEVGKAMQMLGYDVIYEPMGDGANVHFYMVLNRDAIVAVKDEWVEAEITDAMLRRGHI